MLFRTLTGLFGQRVTPDPKDLDVRLMDGPTGNEGRIEIFVSHKFTWPGQPVYTKQAYRQVFSDRFLWTGFLRGRISDSNAEQN